MTDSSTSLPASRAFGRPQAGSPLYRQVAAWLGQRIKRGDFDRDRKLPSVRQLAIQTRVSHGVAQRALHHLQSQRLIESRPAVGSRMTRRRRHDQQAFLLAFIQPSDDLWSFSLCRHLEKTLDDRQNLCVMRTSDHDPARERRIADHLLANGVNGLLLLPVESDANRKYWSAMAERLPLVLVDRTLDGVAAPSVVLNYRRLGQQLVQDWVDRGCRRILFLNDPLDISSYRDFRFGLHQAMDEHGLTGGLRTLDYPLAQALKHGRESGEDQPLQGLARAVGRCWASERFDAVFSLQHEAARFLLAGHVSDRPWADRSVHWATLVGSAVQARDLKALQAAGVQCWNAPHQAMLSTAMQMLQEMVMGRRAISRHIQLDFDLIPP